jgi:hypothetical protein
VPGILASRFYLRRNNSFLLLRTVATAVQCLEFTPHSAHRLETEIIFFYLLAPAKGKHQPSKLFDFFYCARWLHIARARPRNELHWVYSPFAGFHLPNKRIGPL